MFTRMITIVILILGTVLAPCEAQQATKIPTIGFLAPQGRSLPLFDGFRQGLADLGYVEGRNVVIEPRFAEGHYERFPDIFAELVGLKVDVIVVTGAVTKWDFEPDSLTVDEGTPIIAVDQGGEPHTFTEVAQFGGGFIPQLNGPNETAVPECAMGFSRVEVARTRILQGSQLQVTGLSKGVHLFQCCIHPWMRTTVVVK